MIKNNTIFTWYDFEISKAQGSFIWDSRGKKYIDFISGWNVTNLGWNHPKINKAVIEQAKKNTYSEMWTPDPILGRYAKMLTKALPDSLSVAIRATGGTEANEEAIKIARVFTGRKKIVGFSPSYHGQSMSTLSLGSDVETMNPMGGKLANYVQLNFPAVKSDNFVNKEKLRIFLRKVEKILKNKDVAAIVTEAGIVTGWGLTEIAPEGYLSELRKITNSYGTLLIVDEVGTGFSRCGKLFGIEIEKVTPDIVTFAKGISNGAGVIGAVVTTREIAKKTQDESMLISTFGWNPMACAAAIETLKEHKRLRLWQKAKKDGKYIRDILQTEIMELKVLDDVRGFGMEIGVSFNLGSKKKSDKFALKVVQNNKKRGLHTILGSDNNIQIMPALNIDRKTLDKGLEIFIDSVKAVKK